jgi:hypothetical protein
MINKNADITLIDGDGIKTVHRRKMVSARLGRGLGAQPVGRQDSLRFSYLFKSLREIS